MGGKCADSGERVGVDVKEEEEEVKEGDAVVVVVVEGKVVCHCGRTTEVDTGESKDSIPQKEAGVKGKEAGLRCVETELEGVEKEKEGGVEGERGEGREEITFVAFATKEDELLDKKLDEGKVGFVVFSDRGIMPKELVNPDKS